MFSITYPNLVHLYHQAERPAPRQVVEPSEKVWGRTANQPNQHSRRKIEGEGTDFYSVFSKVMERRAD